MTTHRLKEKKTTGKEEKDYAGEHKTLNETFEM